MSHSYPTPLQIAFRVVASLTMFVATEYVLDVCGLDTLADYSEFLTGQQELVILNNTFNADSFALPPMLFG
jgi:hypothetical protein